MAQVLVVVAVDGTGHTAELFFAAGEAFALETGDLCGGEFTVDARLFGLGGEELGLVRGLREALLFGSCEALLVSGLTDLVVKALLKQTLCGV